MIECLLDYAAALLHFLEAHIIPVEGIALGTGRNFKIKPVVDFVRFAPANVERDSAGAQVRSGNSVLAGQFLVDHADIPGTVYENDVLRNQVVVIGPACSPCASEKRGSCR